MNARQLNVWNILLVLSAWSACAAGAVAGSESSVRPADCAGSWYPADADKLAAELDALLAKAPAPSRTDRPLAIISPHAGYRYSAPVAATGYRWLRGHSYKRVIVMAFSHARAGTYTGVDVPGDLTAYTTPLGDVPIDRAVCDQLLKHPLFATHDGVDRGEHSLELQLPFLQKSLKEFQLVPLLLGRMSTEDYAQAAEAILPWIDNNTLLVASSDFTHFGVRFGYVPFEENIRAKLHELADAAAAPILRCDFDGFDGHLQKTRDTICGRGPILLLLRLLSMRGGAEGIRAGFDTSGDLTGDWSNSVSYQSIVFVDRPGTLNLRERTELLSLARRTVETYLQSGERLHVDPSTLSAPLRSDGACFVTLENAGQLRGCIGNMVADGPLYEAVIRNAVSACQDSRFVSNPVTSAELERLDIEISYLTPMQRVRNVDDIIIGRHGLLVSLGYRRGVLLPQVAGRRGWTRAEFLAQTCRKAGLPMDAWKQPDAELYCFEAEVFGEADSAEGSTAGRH